MPDAPTLARRDAVELVRTGRWDISTGRWTATRDDLAAAVAAMSCPAVRRPALKIGHQDERFTPGDGEPAIGWVENLRTADDGHTLIGDYVGVPAWIDQIMASAWPDRSVEGTYNHRCGIGHTHPFVLTGVALLGVTPPGVGTLTSLTDVQALFGLAASGEPAGGEVRIVATIPGGWVQAADGEPVNSGAMVALIPTAADAERLAVDGGEPADKLHVTLAYLGDAVDLGAAGRQDIIDTISAAINGMPVVEADAFAVSVFNPADEDKDPCLVLGMTGPDLEVAHQLVGDALAGVDVPEQHSPWHAHLSLIYSGDINRLAGLVDRTGPVRFDRLRIAFAGQHFDIPLLSEAEPIPTDDDGWDPVEVEAAGDDDRLKRYWLGKGRARWETWTDLYKHLRQHVSPGSAKRIAAAWFRERYGYWPGDRRNRVHASQDTNGDTMPNPNLSLVERIHQAWNASDPPEQQWIVEAADDEVIVMDNTDRSLLRVPVAVKGDAISFGKPQRVRTAYVPDTEPVSASRLLFASAVESRHAVPDPPDVPAGAPQPAPVDDPAPPASPELPAAEPEQPTEPEEEDPVSTLSTDVRSRLGLEETADDAAVLAAVEALQSRANDAPDPQEIEASAAKNAELEQEVRVLASQVQTMSAQLAASAAEKAATVKAGVLDEAQRLGKFAPADREQWEKDYDDAPAAITRVLASIAPGTVVPVSASGYTADGEPPAVDPHDLTGIEIDAWASQLGIDPKELTRG